MLKNWFLILLVCLSAHLAYGCNADDDNSFTDGDIDKSDNDTGDTTDGDIEIDFDSLVDGDNSENEIDTIQHEMPECKDGVCFDNDSGLTWEEPIEKEFKKWNEAVAYCENLQLDNHDDWRLPTISELRTLIRGCPSTEPGGICGISDSCLSTTCEVNRSCMSCDSLSSYLPNNMEKVGASHWSSSKTTNHEDKIWLLGFFGAWITNSNIVEVGYARCVRGDFLSFVTTTTYGTWHDSSTDLIWQNPDAGVAMFWQEAKDYCNNLWLVDKNDWRLPTISELRTLIRGCPSTEPGGICGVTDDCHDISCWNKSACMSCPANEGPSNGCYWPDEIEGYCFYPSMYASSSTYMGGMNGDTLNRWHISSAIVGGMDASYSLSDVRCVR